MHKSSLKVTSILVAAGFATGSLANAATLAVNFDGDYVSAAQNLAGTQQTTIIGNDRFDVIGDPTLVSALSPAANYSGPTFYGAFGTSLSNPNGGNAINAPTFTRQVRQGDARDDINVTTNNYSQSGTTGSAAEFVLFKKEDFLNGLDSTTVSLDGTSVLSLRPFGANTARFGAGRFLVMNGGTMYVSNSTWTITSNSSPVNAISLDPTSTTWAIYAPTPTNLNFNQASTFSSMTFDNVTGLGFYGERDGFASYNLQISTFTAEVTAVPEPSTYALVIAAGLVALTVTRRRMRSVGAGR